MSVNKVILLGNVGKDPEIRTLSNGGEVASFSLATTDSWKDKQTGEKKDRTEWHRIVVFSSGLVGIIKNYIKKGSKLYIEGSLQTRKYTKDGQDHYVTEIVLQGYGCILQLLDSRDPHSTPKTDEEATREFADRNGGKVVDTVGLVKQEDEFVEDVIDDDIPF